MMSQIGVRLIYSFVIPKNDSQLYECSGYRDDFSIAHTKIRRELKIKSNMENAIYVSYNLSVNDFEECKTYILVEFKDDINNDFLLELTKQYIDRMKKIIEHNFAILFKMKIEVVNQYNLKNVPEQLDFFEQKKNIENKHSDSSKYGLLTIDNMITVCESFSDDFTKCISEWTNIVPHYTSKADNEIAKRIFMKMRNARPLWTLGNWASEYHEREIIDEPNFLMYREKLKILLEWIDIRIIGGTYIYDYNKPKKISHLII